MTWNEAIKRALELEKIPATAARILEIIQTNGFREITGQTPVDTVGAVLATNPKFYVRTSPGLFRLRDASKEPFTPPAPIVVESELPPTAESLITYFGLMWDRNDGHLRKGLMQGMADGEPMNLEGKKGIYLLFSNEVLVYVGRVTDRTIARRLDEHTKDNLGHRWNKFSFFLFNESQLDVTANIVGMEALLLEILNPTCNRGCGQLKGGTEVYPLV